MSRKLVLDSFLTVRPNNDVLPEHMCSSSVSSGLVLLRKGDVVHIFSLSYFKVGPLSFVQ
jgi:hypothetical protein